MLQLYSGYGVAVIPDFLQWVVFLVVLLLSCTPDFFGLVSLFTPNFFGLVSFITPDFFGFDSLSWIPLLADNAAEGKVDSTLLP